MKSRLLVVAVFTCFIFSSCCSGLNYLLAGQNKSKNKAENHAVVKPEPLESNAE